MAAGFPVTAKAGSSKEERPLDGVNGSSNPITEVTNGDAAMNEAKPALATASNNTIYSPPTCVHGKLDPARASEFKVITPVGRLKPSVCLPLTVCRKPLTRLHLFYYGCLALNLNNPSVYSVCGPCMKVRTLAPLYSRLSPIIVEQMYFSHHSEVVQMVKSILSQNLVEEGETRCLVSKAWLQGKFRGSLTHYYEICL